MKLSLLYLTVKDKSHAQQIARTLLAEKRIACANIIEGVTSIYVWENKLEETSEAILLLKTRQDLAESTRKRAAELHGYDCPCILEFSPENAHPPFAEWVAASTLD